ncbi:hypothetical protein BaRGS_00030023, partial [Batillaria attramentaria]
YYAIVHPLSAMKFNSKSRTRRILAATWVIPVVLASPYTFSKSYAFVISSEMGSISRQICTDRFDEIDTLMYGSGVSGRFRSGFFIFLFLVIYLLPMLVILATCVRIAICLLQPISVRRWPPATRKDTGRRHEENKRKFCFDSFSLAEPWAAKLQLEQVVNLSLAPGQGHILRIWCPIKLAKNTVAGTH